MDPGPPYQCVGVPGRLGNALFTWASSLGVATMHNRTLVLEQNNPVLKYFSVKALVNCNKTICHHTKDMGKQFK